MTKKETKGACVVCCGKIIEKIVSQFDPCWGPAIIGPGSKQQYTEVSGGFYCEKCGLKYEFLPAERKK